MASGGPIDLRVARTSERKPRSKVMSSVGATPPWGKVGKWASGQESFMSELVEVDRRRRVTLGQHPRHQRYLITSECDGTVILTPALVVSELEARPLRRPDLIEKVRADLAAPETRMKRRRTV